MKKVFFILLLTCLTTTQNVQCCAIKQCCILTSIFVAAPTLVTGMILTGVSPLVVVLSAYQEGLALQKPIAILNELYALQKLSELRKLTTDKEERYKELIVEINKFIVKKSDCNTEELLSILKKLAVLKKTSKLRDFF